MRSCPGVGASRPAGSWDWGVRSCPGVGPSRPAGPWDSGARACPGVGFSSEAGVSASPGAAAPSFPIVRCGGSRAVWQRYPGDLPGCRGRGPAASCPAFCCPVSVRPGCCGRGPAASCPASCCPASCCPAFCCPVSVRTGRCGRGPAASCPGCSWTFRRPAPGRTSGRSGSPRLGSYFRPRSVFRPARGARVSLCRPGRGRPSGRHSDCWYSGSFSSSCVAPRIWTSWLRVFSRFIRSWSRLR